MEMQHVRYFLALCEERNFTRAARRCGVSQPTLTLAIKQIESELGGALFSRARRASTLTALGAAVRPHIAAAATAVAHAQREAASFRAANAPPRPTSLVVPFQPEENAMRKVVFLAAVAVVLLLAAGALSRVLHPATAAQHAFAGKAVDVYAIEKTIDVQALPRVDTLSEAEE